MTRMIRGSIRPQLSFDVFQWSYFRMCAGECGLLYLTLTKIGANEMHHPARLEQLEFQRLCARMGVRMSVRKNSPRPGDTGTGDAAGLVRRGCGAPGCWGGVSVMMG